MPRDAPYYASSSNIPLEESEDEVSFDLDEIRSHRPDFIDEFYRNEHYGVSADEPVGDALGTACSYDCWAEKIPSTDCERRESSGIRSWARRVHWDLEKLRSWHLCTRGGRRWFVLDKALTNGTRPMARETCHLGQLWCQCVLDHGKTHHPHLQVLPVASLSLIIIFSGSVSVMASFLDSCLDLLSGSILFVTSFMQKVGHKEVHKWPVGTLSWTTTRY